MTTVDEAREALLDQMPLDVERLAVAYHASNCPQRRVAYHSCPHRDAHRKTVTSLAAEYARLEAADKP